MSLGGVICIGIAVGAVGWWATGRVIVLARRHSFLDIPNQRSSHDFPVPLGGGLVLVAAVFAAALGGAALELLPWELALALLPALSAVAAVSFLDDVRPLGVSKWIRLLVHTVAAAWVVSILGPVDTVYAPLVGEIDLGDLGWPLTVIGIAFVINAYNFMDGIDGLAGSHAVLAGIGWAVIGVVIGVPSMAILGTALAASSAAFLGRNWHPATLFLGDVGATSLGLIFATLSVSAAGHGTMLATVGVAALWLFLFDAGFTLAVRLFRGENIFRAHREHLFQRLIDTGCRHDSVALLYLSMSAAVAGVAVAALALAPGALWLLAPAMLLSAAVLLVVVRAFENRAEAAQVEAPGAVPVFPVSATEEVAGRVKLIVLPGEKGQPPAALRQP